MKQEIEEEIEKLNASLHNFYQFRNTEAVNRLAMLSMMLGAGAVVTGFFGMNFGRDFARLFFEPDQRRCRSTTPPWHLVALVAFGAIAFGFRGGQELVGLLGDPGARPGVGAPNHDGSSLRKGPTQRGPRRTG